MTTPGRPSPGRVLNDLLQLNIMLHNCTTRHLNNTVGTLVKESIVEMIEDKIVEFDLALDHRYALMPGIRPHI